MKRLIMCVFSNPTAQGGAAYFSQQHHGGFSRGVGAVLGGGAHGGAVDFPLRILVQSDMVGAIIGRGGQTIRQITQQTRARVDVHRRDSGATAVGAAGAEKAITIYGQPENCTNACNRILRVIEVRVCCPRKTV